MDFIVLNGIRYTLPELEAWLWTRLADAGKRPRQPWRNGVLATEGPNARMVVLRAAYPASRKLLLYTDIRSAKVGEIALNPQVTWVFWDERRQQQLRVRGEAHVCADPEMIREHRQRLPERSRKDYAAPAAPGAPLRTGETHAPDDPEVLVMAHFAIVETRVSSVDWLQLGRDGHCRAIFDYQDQSINARWVTP